MRQSGRLSCFFAGFVSFLAFSISSDCESRARSERGWMTSSMKPSSAALYGFANFSLYSAMNAARVAAGSALFAIYGLAICLLFRGSNAPGIASGMVVVMAFLGNVFTPMDGLMLDLGRFTPLYGYVALARFPLTDGSLPTGGQDPLWLPIANVIAWTVIFSLLAMWGVRRSRART